VIKFLQVEEEGEKEMIQPKKIEADELMDEIEWMDSEQCYFKQMIQIMFDYFNFKHLITFWKV